MTQEDRTLLRQTWEQRLAPRKAAMMDIVSELHHFALINYAVPLSRLRPYIHHRFEIESFKIKGVACGLISVVPFEDVGFHFRKLRFLRFDFFQTNYRIYVIDSVTKQRVVWFLGTTLGSWTVRFARLLWKIPWYPAKYDCVQEWSPSTQSYDTFRYNIESKWASATIDLHDTGEAVGCVPGFDDHDEMMLCLTHPVQGFFYRLDGKLGSYSVSHAILPITKAEPIDLRFDLLERMNILSDDEMKKPHSVFLCQKTTFNIHMPPFVVREDS